MTRAIPAMLLAVPDPVRCRSGAVVARIAALVLLCATASAHALERPTGPVILTVSGSIAHTNGPGVAEFDLAMLRSLDVTSFDTSTIWTEGVSRYEGVRLSVLLQAVGAEGEALTAKALNDYSVTFPVAEVEPDAPILAFGRDGAPMSVRDKGPLWILYPFDARAAYQSEQVYARSVWQLNRLRVDP